MGDQDSGAVATLDWEAIERSADFQELVKGRRRFAWTLGGLGTGLGVLYVVLAGVAPDFMGTKLIGSFSIGFAGGVLLIVVTWAITIAYMRRSDRVWGPLEARIREQALPSAGRSERGEGSEGVSP